MDHFSQKKKEISLLIWAFGGSIFCLSVPPVQFHRAVDAVPKSIEVVVHLTPLHVTISEKGGKHDNIHWYSTFKTVISLKVLWYERNKTLQGVIATPRH